MQKRLKNVAKHVVY